MSTISLQIIESIPFLPVKPCTLEKSYPTLQTKINIIEKEYLVEDCKKLGDHLEERDWTSRMVAHLMVSEKILSITFHPFDSSKSHILFVQKMNQLSQVTGFFSPSHFPLKVQKEIQATSDGPPTFKVKDPESFEKSFEGLENYQNDLIPLLELFIKDPETRFIGVTFQDSNQFFFSRGWKKA